MKQYIDLILKIKKEGIKKSDRTGTGTISIFGHQSEYDLRDGFPLLTLKKTHFPSVVYENLWFLQGGTNTKYLTDNKVKIWNEWADENGNLGPVYGKQWVDWEGINQIQIVIDKLTEGHKKFNPMDRGLVVSAWNVADLSEPDNRSDDELYQEYLKKIK